MTFRKQAFIFWSMPLYLASLCSPASSASLLAVTPPDYEGPFYPIVRQTDEDNDLIHVAGRNQVAQGLILHLSGRVVDQAGRPFADAVVEIWQTDPNGRYNDKRDRSPGMRDPNFQYWGMAVTREDGSYFFTTLVPGAYEPRPAHIHYKVWVNRELRLTSQIYFKNINGLLEGMLAPSTDNELQTADLHKNKEGEFETVFQIVLAR